MLPFFAAESGIRSNALLSKGYISLNALKKALPERIKELLRVMNYLATIRQRRGPAAVVRHQGPGLQCGQSRQLRTKPGGLGALPIRAVTIHRPTAARELPGGSARFCKSELRRTPSDHAHRRGRPDEWLLCADAV
jgi:hypothetical protein